MEKQKIDIDIEADISIAAYETPKVTYGDIISIANLIAKMAMNAGDINQEEYDKFCDIFDMTIGCCADEKNSTKLIKTMKENHIHYCDFLEDENVYCGKYLN